MCQVENQLSSSDYFALNVPRTVCRCSIVGTLEHDLNFRNNGSFFFTLVSGEFIRRYVIAYGTVVSFRKKLIN